MGNNVAIKVYRGLSTALATLASTGSAGVLAYTTDTQQFYVDQGSGNAGYGVPGSGKAWIQANSVAISFSGSLAGDVTGTQAASVVGKLNGVSLAGLATGILKNTTTTGVPSIATAGTDYAGLAYANIFTAAQSFTKGFSEGTPASSVPVSSGTIAITSPVSIVAPTAAITGMILTSGTVVSQTVTIINNSAYTITFAAVATSHVADGVSDIIAALTSRTYIWSGTSWFRES
jgi:hypothetical protein